MNPSGGHGSGRFGGPDRLYTWVDVERYFAGLVVQGRWPGWLREVDAYWYGVRLVVDPSVSTVDVWSYLKEALGPLTVDEEKQVILLDTASEGDPDRLLQVEIDASPDAAAPVPRPQWSAHRVVPGLSGALDPPRGDIPQSVSICAFHSFKGGVGRTLHCVATALAVARSGRRVLLIDADLEAPGITWMWQAQARRVDFAFEDFLALVHGSDRDDYSQAINLGARFLANQQVDGITVMPARRDYAYIEPSAIEPIDLLTADRDPYVLTNALAELGHRLGTDVVLLDLRAGVSELNAPLLLDPRLLRVIVSTISDQSVRGSARVLAEIGRRAPTREASEDPSVAILITQFTEPDHRERLEAVATELADAAIGTGSTTGGATEEAALRVPIMASRFDASLLNLAPNWDGVCAAVSALRLDEPLQPLVESLAPRIEVAATVPSSATELDAVRRSLERTADRLVFAERSGGEDFLVTEALDNLVEAHRTAMPIEVIVGAKGSGKTFTFLQLCARESWSDFAHAAGVEAPLTQAITVPVIDSTNLDDAAKEQLDDRRIAMAERFGGTPADRTELRDMIKRQILQDADEITWRKTWLACLARSVGLPATAENAQDLLTAFARGNQALFVIDGLEDLFRDFVQDERERRALRVLLTDCTEWLRALRQRPLGLLVFIRRDLAQAAIVQNFGQFEARYGNYALRWNRTEAVRLAAWVCQRGSALIASAQLVKDADAAELSQMMIPVWGEKMGSERSREARSEQWFIAALSDFTGQIQARDVVTFIGEAAKRSIGTGDRKGPARVLAPAAMRNALTKCSSQKIEAIKQENAPVSELLDLLSGQPLDKRKVPFSLDSVGLSLAEARLLEANGALFREDDQYWIPEIFRHGLGFRATGRPRVLAIANLVRRRNDLGS